MSEPLYALTGQYLRLLKAAEEGADVGEYLAAIEDSIEAKGMAIAKVLASLEADSETAAEESARLAERAKSYANQAARLREYVKVSMMSAGITRIKGPAFTISLQSGSPKVRVVDESKIPDAYIREKTTREPNKVAILDAFKQLGENVPGCEIDTTTTLRIR